MEDFRGQQPTTGKSLKDEIAELRETIEFGQGKQKTKQQQQGWKMPGFWRRKVKKAKRDMNNVLIFYLDNKGRMQKPRLMPILAGDIVLIKNKAYDANPEHLWTLGKKGPKALIIREIDRRPVSNLDYSQVKEDGFSTDSDEILIKATMKAMLSGTKKAVNKAAIVVGILIIGGVLVYMFSAGP